MKRLGKRVTGQQIQSWWAAENADQGKIGKLACLFWGGEMPMEVLKTKSVLSGLTTERGKCSKAHRGERVPRQALRETGGFNCPET